MDKILIKDLLARCIVGINDEERREKQDVVINITLTADLKKACLSDRFEDTVDYRAIKKKVLTIVESSRLLSDRGPGRTDRAGVPGVQGHNGRAGAGGEALRPQVRAERGRGNIPREGLTPCQSRTSAWGRISIPKKTS